MKYKDISSEETLKNHVKEDFFNSDGFEWEAFGSIDFALKIKRQTGEFDFDDEYLLWAEAKKKEGDHYDMLTQLILTIGKARTFDKKLPPKFLGCFGCEKISFVPYNEILDIFYQNDFNWNVTPSNKETKEFRVVRERVESILGNKDITYSFDFTKEEQALKEFIKQNFHTGGGDISKIRVDKNNFIFIYHRWLKIVKPTIDIQDWEKFKTEDNILDAVFFHADLLSKDNETLGEELEVLLKKTKYEVKVGKTKSQMLPVVTFVGFKDNQKAHKEFWNKYERPPAEEYQKRIKARLDLLVPQDVRERKGSFFTPEEWVNLSMDYLKDYLGDNWQDEYTVWDCAAGTGNLLDFMLEKRNVWASTLDPQDVCVMRDMIKKKPNLYFSHIFQFDFLNDEFIPKRDNGKIPDKLYDIISDEDKRKKLIIYINPPYAEAGDSKQRTGTGKNKDGVAINTAVYKRYGNVMGKASVELFAQFLMRVYREIPSSVLANFSTLKNLQAPNFAYFRKHFRAKLEKIFVVPSRTFDNVKGVFPIGFFIWNTGKEEVFDQIVADVYDRKNKMKPPINYKTIYCCDKANKVIGVWLAAHKDKNAMSIGTLKAGNNDFQAQDQIYIQNKISKAHYITVHITRNNLIPVSIYFAVRKVIPATWLNDRDQFLYPNDGWKTDFEFQNDCLSYTLFNNDIQSKYGMNHWIPFKETEFDNLHDNFESNFMTDFIDGNIRQEDDGGLFAENTPIFIKREFSSEAKAVFDAGRKLWRYYHEQPNSNINASLYDIREHFQGREDDTGNMTPINRMKSADENNKYILLRSVLSEKLKLLSSKIEPKVYEYGFLKQ
jgi:hypothetical protein